MLSSRYGKQIWGSEWGYQALRLLAAWVWVHLRRDQTPLVGTWQETLEDVPSILLDSGKSWRGNILIGIILYHVCIPKTWWFCPLERWLRFRFRFEVYEIADLNEDTKAQAIEQGHFKLHEGDPLFLGLRWYMDPFGDPFNTVGFKVVTKRPGDISKACRSDPASCALAHGASHGAIG